LPQASLLYPALISLRLACFDRLGRRGRCPIPDPRPPAVISVWAHRAVVTYGGMTLPPGPGGGTLALWKRMTARLVAIIRQSGVMHVFRSRYKASDQLRNACYLSWWQSSRTTDSTVALSAAVAAPRLIAVAFHDTFPPPVCGPCGRSMRAHVLLGVRIRLWQRQDIRVPIAAGVIRPSVPTPALGSEPVQKRRAHSACPAARDPGTTSPSERVEHIRLPAVVAVAHLSHHAYRRRCWRPTYP